MTKPEHRGSSIGAGSLADIEGPPRILRIRAGEVHVELEWPAQHEFVVPPKPVQAHAVPEENDETAAGLFDLCAPTVGTFYVAPEPGAPPFIAEGDQVRAGQQVGIVEAMKLMIPVSAERDGQVVAVIAANASSVEYGDRLITFATPCTEQGG
jgi:acetyl-CoA carboxylase biotin carboxyl carrier protein